MEILVCGATGFVGAAITQQLLSDGHAVRALTRSGNSASSAKAMRAPGEVEASGLLVTVQGDVTQPQTLSRAVSGVDAIIQAVQFKGAPVEDPARGLTYEKVDRDGTINLLRAVAQEGGRPHFLYMSGITVRAGAKGPWNMAKWQAEQAIRESGLDWTIVRSCWAYGPRDNALNRLLGFSDYLPFVPIFGSGRQPLTPVWVQDIGRLFELMVTTPDACKDTVFKVGGPDDVTLAGFLRLALRIMRRRRPVLPIPLAIGHLQARLLQHLPGRLLTPEAVDFVAQEGYVTEEDRALLGERFPEFRPTPLPEGLSSYLSR